MPGIGKRGRPKLSERKLKEDEVDNRRMAVSELRLQGKSAHQISASLGWAVGTVQNDLNFIRDQWRSRAAADFDSLMAEQYEQLVTVQQQAWKSFKASVTRKRPEGDGRFLQLVADTAMKIRDLLGLDDPLRYQALRIREAGEGDTTDFVFVVVDSQDERKEIQTDSGLRFLSFADYADRLRETARIEAGIVDGKSTPVKEPESCDTDE